MAQSAIACSQMKHPEIPVHSSLKPYRELLLAEPLEASPGLFDSESTNPHFSLPNIEAKYA